MVDARVEVAVADVEEARALVVGAAALMEEARPVRALGARAVEVGRAVVVVEGRARARAVEAAVQREAAEPTRRPVREVRAHERRERLRVAAEARESLARKQKQRPNRRPSRLGVPRNDGAMTIRIPLKSIDAAGTAQFG